MQISKDLYEYLLDFSDDKTVLNLLSVNKKFRDEKLFERVMRKRYPILVEKYKKYRETWKSFSIDMMQNINKMEKEYDIPYIPSWDFNPRNYGNADFADHILISAAQIGLTDVVEMLMAEYPFSKETFEKVFEEAAKNNQVNTIDFLLNYEEEFDSWKPNEDSLDREEYWNIILAYSAWGGHIDLFQKMVQKGAYDFTSSFQFACMFGNLNIIEIIPKNRVRGIKQSMFYATCFGNIKVIRYLVENFEHKFYEEIKNAAKRGDIYFIKEALYDKYGF